MDNLGYGAAFSDFSRLALCWPVAASYNRIVPCRLLPPLASVLPSGENATVLTTDVCPVSMALQPGVSIIEPNRMLLATATAVWRIRDFRYPAFTESRFGTFGQTPSGIVLPLDVWWKIEYGNNNSQTEKPYLLHLLSHKRSLVAFGVRYRNGKRRCQDEQIVVAVTNASAWPTSASSRSGRSKGSRQCRPCYSPPCRYPGCAMPSRTRAGNRPADLLALRRSGGTSDSTALGSVPPSYHSLPVGGQ